MGRRKHRNYSEPNASLKTHFSRPLTVRLSRLDFVSPAVNLAQVEDRRTHHPLDFFRPARMLSGHPVQPLNVNKLKRPAKFKSPVVPHGLRFAVPEKTVMCVRRKKRREVLFAKKRAGGAGSRKPKTRNWYSKIGC